MKSGGECLSKTKQKAQVSLKVVKKERSAKNGHPDTRLRFHN